MKPTDALPHPREWGTTTVAQDIEIKRGISWSKEQEHAEPGQGRVPVIRIGNVQENLELDDLLYLSGLAPAAIKKKRVSDGWAAIVGSNGNRKRVGNAVLIKDGTDFLFASFLLAACPKTESHLKPKYFYRWLTSEQVQAYLSASSEGTTGLNNLSHSFFRSMAIPVPSQIEQESIAYILDAADKGIEQTQEAVGRAEKLKDSLLQKFLYEALGETAYADRPGKPLPSGWSLALTDKLLEIEPKNGISPTTNSQPPGIPTFSIAAIRNGTVDLKNTDNLKYAILSEKIAKIYHINRGDILIVRGNANADLVGKAAMVDEYPNGCIYPDITKRVFFRQYGDISVTPEYALLVWNHCVVHNQLLRRAKTSNGTLKINTRDIKQIIIPVAPRNKQDQIVSLTQVVKKKISALNEMVITQQMLKKSLMHDLLTGKVRVNHAIDKILSMEAS